jgi:uncharacterized membrane protein YfcA
MTDLHIATSLLVFCIFLMAGLVKGMLGMGLPTVAMGLLGAVMSPVTAASLLIVPSVVTNVWQLLAGPHVVALARRLGFMLAGIAFGTLVGVQLLTGDMAGWASTALGLVLIVYAAIGLSSVQLHVPPRAEFWLSPVVGLTTGLITGATGISVIPLAPYLQALDLEREDLIQSLGLSFTVSMVALAVGLGAGGAWQSGTAAASLLALAPAMLGMAAGQALRRRVDPVIFRRWFFIGLLALGAHLAL